MNDCRLAINGEKGGVCHFGIALTNAGGERVINGGFCLRTNLLSS